MDKDEQLDENVTKLISEFVEKQLMGFNVDLKCQIKSRVLCIMIENANVALFFQLSGLSISKL